MEVDICMHALYNKLDLIIHCNAILLYIQKLAIQYALGILCALQGH